MSINGTAENDLIDVDLDYPIHGIAVYGKDGKSAYQYATEAGYTGTEEEFAEKLAGGGNVDLTGVVKSVNGKTPDKNGNVEITVPDSGGNVELDTTLTQEGKAADSKAVGDAIGQLSDLHSGGKSHTEWTKGAIGSTTGKNQSGATRIRTSWFLHESVKSFTPATGYKYMVFVYSKEDGSFVGILNGTEIINTSKWLTEKTDVSTQSKQYLFRVVLAKTDDGTISATDGTNLNIDYYTDYSLSVGGVPADSKTVGNYVEDQKIHGVVDLNRFANEGSAETNGITCNRNLDGAWTVNGTATGTTLCRIMSNYPAEGNKTYFVDMALCPVPIRIYWKFADGTDKATDVVKSGYVKSPENTVALIYGFFFRSGDTYENVTAKCKFLSLPSDSLNVMGALASTNDETDRTADIEFMLQTFGECRLMAGNYYVRDIHVPDESIVSGCGRKTKIYLYGEGAGNCFVLGSGCTIKDMELVDPYDESVIVPPSNLERNGILFENTPTKKGTIANCHIRNFNGSGIKLTNTGMGSMNGMNISDCEIENCYYGINIAEYSEFHRITNVSMTQNRFGCVNNGGNNQFACCGFNSNMYNFVIDNSNGDKINNSHGACVGCNFHHAASSDPKRSVMIKGSTSGYLFSGCHFDNGRTLIENSTRIVFDGCNFMKEFELFVDGQGSKDGVNEGNLIIFNGSTFRNTFESIGLSNGADRNGIKFVGCFYQDGTEVNPN